LCKSRAAMTQQMYLKVLVIAGYYDVATPFNGIEHTGTCTWSRRCERTTKNTASSTKTWTKVINASTEGEGLA